MDKPPVKLTALESQTLGAWIECEIHHGFGFKVVAELCQTPPHMIRRVVRALARKGMLKYSRALFNEYDNSMSAGYILTVAGASVLHEREDARTDGGE